VKFETSRKSTVTETNNQTQISSTGLPVSFARCKQITLGHYENFPVASLLVSKQLRKAIFAVYAFARTADDAADESADKAIAIKLLSELKQKLHSPEIFLEDDDSLFPALHQTIQQFNLPLQYFDDLLSAFEYDVSHNHFQTWEDMRNYCQKSAVPVGRLVLALHGLHQEPLLGYSDDITTALQLTNFWQDISEDIKKERVYVPLEVLEKFNLQHADISISRKQEQKTQLINSLVEQTKLMFLSGQPILKFLPFRLKQEIRLTISGGMSILEKTEQLGSLVFEQRPRLNKWDWIKVLTGK